MSKEKRNLPTEAWKDIDSNGYYQVSNKGRIRSWRLQRSPDKTVDEPKLLKQGISKCGYCRVNLCIEKEKRFNVHRLVAEAFIPNPKGKPIINHKDGNKSNNNVGNLEWCTYQENMDHAVKNGLNQLGERNRHAKLTETDVLDIRNAYKLGCFTQKEIAKAYNVKRQSIWAIVHNKTWSHL